LLTHCNKRLFSHYSLMKSFLRIVFVLSVLISCIACDPDPEEETIIPKPRAYPRIDFPSHTYKTYDSICPYKFETPVYSVVRPDEGGNTEPCWINIFYPRFGAVIHVSYKVIDGNLEKYLIDSDDLAKKHTVKANGLEENPIFRDSAKVFGLLYDIKGNAATSLQFYVTDSTKNFLRGSLYFNVPPNIDSLEPVINFLREDVIHMIETFNWKKSDLKLKVEGEVKKTAQELNSPKNKKQE
jgi:gliding motility-associated lipoprotein GldD